MAAGEGQGCGVRRDAETWCRVFQRQQASGLSIVAYCRNEGIAESTFYRWRTQLGIVQAPRLPVSAKHAFVDLGTLQTAPPPSNTRACPSELLELHLDLGGGLSLHLVRR